MNHRHGIDRAPTERTAYILDDVWPEYAAMVAAERRPDDQLIAPGPSPRYGWPGRVDHRAIVATLRRHLAMRRVAKASGGVRQRAYLEHDRLIARSLASAIDYRAAHLVIAQSWLPWLDEAGVLGGRSFDVVMSRYPFVDLHRMLDAVAADQGASPTIRDFRADAALVERETALLASARRIITPHHGIAALFPDRALRLAWHRPAAITRARGDRTGFLGPTITRQRPDLVRAHTASLDQPLIVFGAILEERGWWDGMAIERRSMDANWLDDIGTILHPATFTHQPRALLQAIACGVRIMATPTSGLDPTDYAVMDG